MTLTTKDIENLKTVAEKTSEYIQSVYDWVSPLEQISLLDALYSFAGKTNAVISRLEEVQKKEQEEQRFLYAIYEPAKTFLKKIGANFGACVTDGYNKQEVIGKATAYYAQKMLDSGEYGESEERVYLATYDQITNEEKFEEITLGIECEEPEDLAREHGTYHRGNL